MVAGVAPQRAFAVLSGAPEWVLEAARVATPTTTKGAPAVVLSRESTSKVARDGSLTRTQRVAIRVLTDSGRSWASFAVPYVQGSTRVRESSAWLIRKGLEVKRSERADWIDVSSDTFGALYSDSRSKAVAFVADAVVGDVFVAETQTTGDALFAEDIHGWGIQGLPVVHETYRLELPAGFTATTFVRGAPSPASQQFDNGRTTVWTLENRPFLPAEPAAPGYESVHPLLLVRFEPPKGVRFKPVVIRQWSELAEWTYRLNNAQCDRNEHLIAEAQRLVGTSSTELEKIRALGRFVQRLHYATLMKGLGQGLGYQPHKATQVLAQRYGDCKDKANLLCALLREVGIEADIAAARIDDGIQAESGFPSPMLFNHAIAAIRVSDAVDVPSVVETNAGRILFFDPTSESTLVGDLPHQLQNSLVFVQRAGNESLTQLPIISPQDGHRLIRRAKLELKSNGTCEGNVVVDGVGQAGAALRNALLVTSTDEMLRQFARQQLSAPFRASDLKSIERRDDELTGICGVAFDLSKNGCLQPLTNSLLVLRTEVFGRSNLPGLTAPERKLPVQLHSLVLDDEIEFTLSDELQVHELPVPVTLISAYGAYSSEFIASGKMVRLVRRLEMKSKTVTADEYPELRKFFSELGKADRSSIVLHRGSEDIAVPGT
jgi:transglutaminase-like putative cysteine protease